MLAKIFYVRECVKFMMFLTRTLFAVISLPKRVAYTEKDSKLQITYYDYVFDPEEENDALERIKVCF